MGYLALRHLAHVLAAARRNVLRQALALVALEAGNGNRQPAKRPKQVALAIEHLALAGLASALKTRSAPCWLRRTRASTLRSRRECR